MLSVTEEITRGSAKKGHQSSGDEVDRVKRFKPTDLEGRFYYLVVTTSKQYVIYKVYLMQGLFIIEVLDW